MKSDNKPLAFPDDLVDPLEIKKNMIGKVDITEGLG